ncbi:hypothetical protein PybrP1_000814 [[Pythium] brassicae (nom. inval.)]|nr:hypothetical protein PybrP1_000814 [[Pythium] brassicae (nom. inval.)]
MGGDPIVFRLEGLASASESDGAYCGSTILCCAKSFFLAEDTVLDTSAETDDLRRSGGAVIPAAAVVQGTVSPASEQLEPEEELHRVGQLHDAGEASVLALIVVADRPDVELLLLLLLLLLGSLLLRLLLLCLLLLVLLELLELLAAQWLGSYCRSCFPERDDIERVAPVQPPLQLRQLLAQRLLVERQRLVLELHLQQVGAQTPDHLVLQLDLLGFAGLLSRGDRCSCRLQRRALAL